MADVRSLLRAERAARRITHPHASYTSDGKLLCNLCDTLVKSEAQWQSHLHSTQHTLRSQRAQEAREARGIENGGGSKKRKAESLDVEVQSVVEKKRVRSNTEDGHEPEEREQSNRGEKSPGPLERDEPDAVVQPSLPLPDPEAPADEAELADFERELEALEAESRMVPSASALNSAATISAAPMTAEQLAATAREEASAQRGKRDQELEEEREDAARAMEEEFEEMEGLEERVRKLRERRETLRRGSQAADDRGGAEAETIRAESGEAGGGSDSEEDDDEGDEWKFGVN